MMHFLFRKQAGRIAQAERIAALEIINAHQEVFLKRYEAREGKLLDAEKALWEWLQARIEYAADPDYQNLKSLNLCANALEVAARKVFMFPGVRGSWGRGAPRDWECGFDPKGSGCECAGAGYAEPETRTCFYREPVGKKEGER